MHKFMNENLRVNIWRDNFTSDYLRVNLPSISMCNELTDATQSSRNKHFIMSIYAVCFSVIKSCTYWDSSTLQALHEHACLLYEKCNVDRVGKLPGNITV